MPNRILKESICASDTIESLSPEEEVFFYRLLVQCDDFGRMDARPAILRARCYPLRLDRVTTQHIVRWLGTLRKAQLVLVYQNDEQPYLQVRTWEKHQQVRAKRSKYPPPDEQALAGDSNGCQVQSDDVICPRNPIRIQSESESNPRESSSTDVDPLSPDAIAELWNAVCGTALSKVSRLTPKRRTHIKARLKEGGRDIDWWKTYFGRILASPFCCGENPRGWKADFDFAVASEESVAKVEEGKYDARQPAAKPLPQADPKQEDAELREWAKRVGMEVDPVV